MTATVDIWRDVDRDYAWELLTEVGDKIEGCGFRTEEAARNVAAVVAKSNGWKIVEAVEE